MNPADQTNSLLTYTFTGQQISSALESHFTAITKQITTIKLENNKLNDLFFVKTAALDTLTDGEYSMLHVQHKKFRSIPEEQSKVKDMIRDIETKFTKPPHLLELCKQIKKLEKEYNDTIDNNNRSLAVLQSRAQTILHEKRKLVNSKDETFIIDTNKISLLAKNIDYQNQLKKFNSAKTIKL